MYLKTYKCPGCYRKWSIDVDGPYVQDEFEAIAFHMDAMHGQNIKE